MRKSPINILASLFYLTLTLFTVAVVVAPAITVVDLPFNYYTGAMLLITSVTIFLSILVFEVWRETGKNAKSLISLQLMNARQRRLGH